MVKDLQVDKNETGAFMLHSVVQRLTECGYAVAGTNVSYFSPKD